MTILTQDKLAKSTKPEIPSLLVLDSKIHFARPFIYGVSGSEKTWWACQMAELGFNVIYLDGDDSSHRLSSLSPEAKARFYHLKLLDKKGLASLGSKGDVGQSVMANFLFKICERVEFTWDMKQQCVVTMKQDPETCIRWRPSEVEKLGTVIVIDSWTSLGESLKLRYFISQKYDLYATLKKEKSDHRVFRDHYNYCGQLSIALAESLKTIPCHCFVIGHEDLNEKRDDDGKVVSARIQPLAISRPVANQLPKYFTDSLHFTLTKGCTMINVKQSSTAEAQSRVVPPGSYKISALTTEKYMQYHGLLLSEEQKRAITPINFNL